MPAANPSPATPDFAVLRQTMVDCQIRTFDVTNQGVLARFLEIPREIFLPAELSAIAYSDATLKISMSGAEETQRCLLPPLILARLLQAADVAASDKILDVAPGTGYSTALLAALGGGDVVAVESDPALAATITNNLRKLNLASARAIVGPLATGAPSEAPFDLIFVNGAVETNLDSLLSQLKEGGRLIAIKVDPTGKGSVKPSHAVRYDKANGCIGWRQLFDASAPVLRAFRSGIQFVF